MITLVDTATDDPLEPSDQLPLKGFAAKLFDELFRRTADLHSAHADSDIGFSTLFHRIEGDHSAPDG